MFKGEVNYVSGVSAYSSEPMKETMGDRIRTLRNSRQLSQDRLGKDLGVSGAAISGWENGQTKDLKIENFLRLCAYFSVSTEWVAFGEDGPPWTDGRRPVRAGKLTSVGGS